MEIHVKVIVSAQKNHIKKEGHTYKVHLSAPALNGKANRMLIEVLAEHFGVRKNQLDIIKGLKSRTKVINIYKII